MPAKSVSDSAVSALPFNLRQICRVATVMVVPVDDHCQISFSILQGSLPW